ncbi:LAMP family protein lmp-1-like [Plakobranchus ocellatus]|uniref:LAMP family protein lmp-1-like n=1 Tax=Plakobranchus ocellatus TaxID=259542 RepID=A0AAV3Z681_9GAST|nr:LAMP family protein lmp-1-like [Plakobranchus ocellatus]
MEPRIIRSSGMLPALALFFLTSHIPTIDSKMFTVKDTATSKLCILVDIDFTIDLAAVRGVKEIGVASYTSEDKNITVEGNCGEIASIMTLNFKNGANWVLKFTQSKGEAFLTKLIQFIPRKVFGEKVPSKQYQLLQDPKVTNLFNSSSSYECQEPDIAQYEPVTVTTENTNFTVTANISYIKAQAFNVKNNNFSRVIHCPSSLPSTSAGTTETTTALETTTTVPETTTEQETTTQQETTTTEQETTTQQETTTITEQGTTTEAGGTTTEEKPTTEKTSPMTEKTTLSPSSTTASPMPHVKLYTVESGEIVCIALEAAFTLDIKYPLKGQSGKEKTAKFFIPDDATANGNCSLSSTSQVLNISFYEDWNLYFIFAKSKQLNSMTLASKSERSNHAEYRISEIGIIAYADDQRFPGSSFAPGSELKYISKDSDLPHVKDNQGYYKCGNPLDIKITPAATLVSQELEVKAFNNDTKADFEGSAAVCSADSSSSRRRTLIIVGCVIAGIVLLCFIIFVVMRIMKRQRDYPFQTLQ